jgi:hypothetical protein
MFGHNDQQPHDGNQPAPDGALDDQSGAAPQVNDTAGDYIEDGGPAAGTPTVTQPDNSASNGGDDATATGGVSDAPTLPEPTATVDDTTTTDDDATDDNLAAAATAPTTPTVASSTTSPVANTDSLLNIKQQALQQLTPLVGHLDQTPEEKFRTTMMMIQAADNHTLIQDAYEAAQQITDEKARAQALLDIVNEINYFTHNTDDSDEAAVAAAA